MKNIGEILSIAAQIAAYILALVLIMQIVKYILGGTWQIEDIILGLLILNLTITFGIGGYLINLSNKISKVDTKIEKHVSWHVGHDLIRK